MAHKFFLNFKQSWITRRGAKVEGPGFNKTHKVHPGTRKCYEYVIKDKEDVIPDMVQLAPVRHRQHPWLFGPATKLSSRSIIYPCNRGKCEVPCACLLCQKKYQKCRAGPFMWVPGVQAVLREPFRLSWVPPYRLQELLQHHVSLASF